ncbi:sulfatase [Streptomyces sp. NBC_01795]|uniref:sulfatase family protein n=1 Tax=unclassified Streptomyces TaxID=2593676 RepID=UPI002DDADB1C|nr:MULTISPECIES: sulfatase [unclassified Streptomyces]WSA94691.1 sulfatase [Streptomyces sp. NBC_01795]WSS12688.1 sulfatase [Streptomyces sp. NBC_01186]
MKTTSTAQAAARTEKGTTGRRRRPVVAVPTAVLGLLLLLLPAATGCVGVQGDDSQGKKKRPNVLMVMTDDQWLESMRALSKTRKLLGDEGVTFDRFHPSSPLCCTSRSTYLSGQFAHNNGVRHNSVPQGGYDKLNEKKTLPVWMQKAGYATSHIGKYPNGYGKKDPKHVPPGWDEWRGSVDPTTYRMWGYQLNENGKLHTYGKSDEEDPKLYQTDVYRDKGVDFIKRKAEGDKPFFLSLAFLAPHGELLKDKDGKPGKKGKPRNKGKAGKKAGSDDNPKSGRASRPAVGPAPRPVVGPAPRPAPRHKGKFANEELPENPAYNESDMRDKPRFLQKRPNLDSQTTEEITESYRGRMESLLAVDEAVEKLMNTLKSTGQLDNTYVVFTSDNGFFFGEHRVPTGKFLPHGASGQVPLVVRGPGIEAGQHSKELTSNVDLAATISDIGGADPDLALDGRSLLPYGRDPRKSSDRPVLQEIAEGARRTPVAAPGHGRPRAGGPPNDDVSAGRAAGAGDLDMDGPASPALEPRGKKKRKPPRGQEYSAAYEAIRAGHYLYIRYSAGGRELYDLESDPHELTSRHNDPGYKKVRTFLDQRLDKLQGCVGEECREEIPQVPDPE